MPVNKEFEYKNFKCEIKWIDYGAPRGIMNLNHYCGYAYVPKSSLIFRKLEQLDTGFEDYPLDVHGGVTYAEEKDNYLVLGFDAAHGDDFDVINNTYRWTEKDIIDETKHLVDELINF